MNLSFQYHYITPRLSEAIPPIPDPEQLIAANEKDLITQSENIFKEKTLKLLGQRVQFLGYFYTTCKDLYLQEALTCYVFAASVEEHVGLSPRQELGTARKIAARLFSLGKAPELQDWETRSFKQLSVPLMKSKPVMMVEYRREHMNLDKWHARAFFKEEKFRPEETKKKETEPVKALKVTLYERLFRSTTPKKLRSKVKQYAKLAKKIEAEQGKGEKANRKLLRKLWIEMGGLLISTDPEPNKQRKPKNMADCYYRAHGSSFRAGLMKTDEELQERVRFLNQK